MTRLRDLADPDHLPALDRSTAITRPGAGLGDDQPPPRILLLYGSLRERSFMLGDRGLAPLAIADPAIGQRIQYRTSPLPKMER